MGDVRHTKPPTSLNFEESVSVLREYRQKRVRAISIKQLCRFGQTASVSREALFASARYLHRELPIRLSQRLSDFQDLPFIVGCNPSLREVRPASAPAPRPARPTLPPWAGVRRVRAGI